MFDLQTLTRVPWNLSFKGNPGFQSKLRLWILTKLELLNQF